ncbi:MAG: SDR family oxidoreductase [Gammaproteobacteria bacterium]|nr:MAG: SDR family oxidoreductase [Gammaproteobacteria bacterium]
MANILITGAGKGIGRATAIAFARAGHCVAAGIRNPDAATELAEIATRETLKISLETLDVDDDLSVNGAIERLTASIGDIDVLVNNAGIERVGAIEDLAMDDFKASMETNYLGAVRCIKAVLPAMREKQSGCIVNVTSITGRLANSPFSAYAASKFALEALSECLAQEVAPFGIRVAIVEPGIIDTGMAERISTGASDSNYPNRNRMAAMFRSSLKQPTPPSLVAEKIFEIAEGTTTQLRHLVGPDAAPFLAWRQAMSDEQWIEWGALDDDAWYARVEADFGLDARPKP